MMIMEKSVRQKNENKLYERNTFLCRHYNPSAEKLQNKIV